VPLLDGVKVVGQLDEVLLTWESWQLVGLTDPDTPLEVKLTDPTGTVGPDEDVSVTVTVQLDAWLTTTGVEQESDVIVEWSPGVMTVSARLPLWEASPVKLAVIWWAPIMFGV
jgi:hypothetical protein